MTISPPRAYSDLIGIPYDDCNCGELVARYFGVTIDQIPSSTRARQLLLQQELLSKTIPIDQIADNAIIVMRRGKLWHIGIAIDINGQLYVLHTDLSIRRSVIELYREVSRRYEVVEFRRYITT